MKKAELLKLNTELLKVIQSQLERINQLEKDVDYWRSITQNNKNSDRFYPTPVDPYVPNPYPLWWDHFVWCSNNTHTTSGDV